LAILDGICSFTEEQKELGMECFNGRVIRNCNADRLKQLKPINIQIDDWVYTIPVANFAYTFIF